MTGKALVAAMLALVLLDGCVLWDGWASEWRLEAQVLAARDALDQRSAEPEAEKFRNRRFRLRHQEQLAVLVAQAAVLDGADKSLRVTPGQVSAVLGQLRGLLAPMQRIQQLDEELSDSYRGLNLLLDERQKTAQVRRARDVDRRRGHLIDDARGSMCHEFVRQGP